MPSSVRRRFSPRCFLLYLLPPCITNNAPPLSSSPSAPSSHSPRITPKPRHLTAHFHRTINGLCQCRLVSHLRSRQLPRQVLDAPPLPLPSSPAPARRTSVIEPLPRHHGIATPPLVFPFPNVDCVQSHTSPPLAALTRDAHCRHRLCTL